jgi:ABC-2 type transport system permease protein
MDGSIQAEKTAFWREYALSGVNWLGFWTLYQKEVRRFLKVYTQTLLAPMITTLLYLLVFLLARGRAGTSVMGISYGAFLAPGLIMMSMTQNAFANTSSSIMIAKVQGNIVDMLMPPLSPGEVIAALALGGVSRGVMVGLVVAVSIWPFAELRVAHPLAMIYFGLSASLMLSLLGVLGGLWSEKFDHMAAVTNFVVMPLSFLSGTFYSAEALPAPLHAFVRFDPFFYMIDGFRYSFIGVADASPVLGAVAMAVLNAALLAGSWRLYAVGYKLKA